MPIAANHDLEVSQITEHAGLEFGAVGEGFGPSDAEVKFMSQHYRQPKAGYWVALVDGQVAGCGGIACLDPANGSCELRKLFVSPHYRGRDWEGFSAALSSICDGASLSTELFRYLE